MEESSRTKSDGRRDGWLHFKRQQRSLKVMKGVDGQYIGGHVSEHDCAALALGLSTAHVGACQGGEGEKKRP